MPTQWPKGGYRIRVNTFSVFAPALAFHFADEVQSYQTLVQLLEILGRLAAQRVGIGSSHPCGLNFCRRYSGGSAARLQ